MILELTLTNLIFLAIAGFGGVWALLKAMAALFVRSQQKLIDDIKRADLLQHALVNERLDGLQRILEKDTNNWNRIERELLTLKAEIPVHYVRRDDYIRGQSVLEAKIDGLGMRMENAQLRAAKLLN